jgi:transposase
MFVEAVLWIVWTGSPWRDLPEVFGPWNSAFRRFSRWSRKEIWWRIFAAMSDGECQDFRVWTGMKGRKEFPHATTKRACDP